MSEDAKEGGMERQERMIIIRLWSECEIVNIIQIKQMASEFC